MIKKKWKILHNKEPKDSSELVKILLQNRNITEDDKNEFLLPSIEKVTPKEVGIDTKELKKAKVRIEESIEKKEKILVFGDYDADGICATTILWETLYKKTKNVMPYIPDRFSEGYGFSTESLANMLKKYPDTKVIITADNGIASLEAVEEAKRKKIDVIVTDHHSKAEKDPDAFAIIYTTKLCGAAVAWMLSNQISEEKDLNKYLDLVAIASVADMVPLTGPNRALVKEGLKTLTQTKRIGLKEIISEAKIGKRSIGIYDIGFIIGPRINAPGRLSHAIESLRLLCTQDQNKAQAMATSIGSKNTKRQQLTKKLTDIAREQVQEKQEDKKIIIAENKAFEEGIVGLIASKLVEEFYKPSLAISIKDDIAKGSARSVSGVNITELIKKASRHLISAGGHPAAAGFSLYTKNLEEFKKVLYEEAEKIIAEKDLEKSIKIDLPLQFEKINLNTYDQIQTLYPFGIGNPEPTFVTKKTVVHSIDHIGKQKNHLKMFLRDNNSTHEAIGFNMTNENGLKPGDTVDIAYTIDKNTWNGNTKIQLKIKDLK